MKKSNLLKDTHPQIALQWDHERNEVSLESVTTMSGKKVHWICIDKGVEHRWEAKVYSRSSNNRGCPICSNQKIVSGINSLFDTDEKLCEEWDYSSNEKTPHEISRGSKYMAHWICRVNPEHKWKASVNNRAGKESQCPKCSRPGGHLKNNLIDEFDPELNPNIDPTLLSVNSHTPIVWRCAENREHTWEVSPNQRTSHQTGCPECRKRTSKAEKELADFIEEYVKVRRNTFDIISPYELDIFIPSALIAVEFNGVYWHSTQFSRDKNQHKNKRDLCHEKGIQLITIWEDDWTLRKDVVKKMILHKLGLSSGQRIYARKTYIDFEVPKNEAKKFQENFHIQGPGSGSIRVGLRDEYGNLVALSIFRKNSEELELVRYCTSVSVIGGQSKILKWVDRNIKYSEMKTFADLCVSTGNLYEKTGWVEDAVISPDYKYVVGNQRKHKFGFRVSRFKNDSNLKYEEGMTEFELSVLNRLYRIYDCGKIRYVRKNPNLV